MSKIEKLQKVILMISESILLLNEFKGDKEVGLGTFFSIENDITHQERLVQKYNSYVKQWKIERTKQSQ